MYLLYDYFEVVLVIASLIELAGCAAVVVVAFFFVRRQSTPGFVLFCVGAGIDALAALGTILLYAPIDSPLYYINAPGFMDLIDNWEAITPLFRGSAFFALAAGVTAWVKLRD